MGWAQLHYTSCRTGLSGTPGFQFNAATPGLDPAVMAAVERLSGYIAPTSIVDLEIDPTGPVVGPINLTFQPGSPDDPSEPALLMQTTYVGHDYSSRAGNFFAHTVLLGPDGAGAALPIEFWRASFWKRVPAPDPSLAELTAPDPPRSSEATARTGSSSWRSRLPAMATATALAVAGSGRSVLVVDRDTDAVAAAIAAVCALLPPRLARRTSFTTYQYRPRHARMHIVGTVPEADVDPPNETSQFEVFDLAGGFVGYDDVHPLFAFIGRIDAADVGSTWQRVERLVDPSLMPTLDEWHEAVALLWISSGGADQADVLATPAARGLAWLGGRLDAGELHRAVSTLITGEALSDVEFVRLLVALPSLGLPDDRVATVTALAEQEVVRRVQRRVRAGAAPFPARITSVAGHAAAGAWVDSVLGTGTPEECVAVLTWAVEADLSLDGALWSRFGESVLGPIVIDGGRVGLLEVFRPRPMVVAGLFDYVNTAVDRHPELVERALDGGLVGLVDAAVCERFPAINELMWLRRARQDPTQRIHVLDLMMARREASAGSVDRADFESLVGRLWGGAPWTIGEAVRLISVVEPNSSTRPELERRSAAAITARGALDHEVLELCGLLTRDSDATASPIRDCMVWADRFRAVVDEAAASRPAQRLDSALRVAAILDHAPFPADASFWSEIDGPVDRLSGAELAAFLATAPRRVADRCRQRVQAILNAGRDRAYVAQQIERLYDMAVADPPAASIFGQVVISGLRPWTSDALDALEVQLRLRDDVVADWFQGWRAEKLEGLVDRLVRRLGFKRRPSGPGSGDGQPV